LFDQCLTGGVAFRCDDRLVTTTTTATLQPHSHVNIHTNNEIQTNKQVREGMAKQGYMIIGPPDAPTAAAPAAARQRVELAPLTEALQRRAQHIPEAGWARLMPFQQEGVMFALQRQVGGGGSTGTWGAGGAETGGGWGGAETFGGQEGRVEESGCRALHAAELAVHLFTHRQPPSN
jgi:hypothetical protein